MHKNSKDSFPSVEIVARFLSFARRVVSNTTEPSRAKTLPIAPVPMADCPCFIVSEREPGRCSILHGAYNKCALYCGIVYSADGVSALLATPHCCCICTTGAPTKVPIHACHDIVAQSSCLFPFLFPFSFLISSVSFFMYLNVTVVGGLRVATGAPGQKCRLQILILQERCPQPAPL